MFCCALLSLPGCLAIGRVRCACCIVCCSRRRLPHPVRSHLWRMPPPKSLVPLFPSCSYVYDSPMPLGRMVRQVADKAQVGSRSVALSSECFLRGATMVG